MPKKQQRTFTKEFKIQAVLDPYTSTFGLGSLCARNEVKYNFIENNRKNFALNIMTRVLSVTTTGYLTWKRRGPSARKQEDNVLREAILPEGAWLGSRRNQNHSREQQMHLRRSKNQKLTRGYW